MNILGINGGFRTGYQDLSAVLLQDGEITAAVEEERLDRIKHSPGKLPLKAIREVLSLQSLTITDIDLVAFHGITWPEESEKLLTNFFNDYFGYAPRVKRFHHHDAHAASAFYASGFDDSLVITVDNSGDSISTGIYIADKKRGIENIKSFSRPQSLGIFYSLITQFCGFNRDRDEYKLMGLAAYGNSSTYNLDWLLSINENGYELNEEYLLKIPQGASSPHVQHMLYSDKFTKQIGFNRNVSEEFTGKYADVAAAAQLQLEKALVSIVKYYLAKTGKRKICMAGGVALNGLANQKLSNLDEVDAFYTSPVSSDAGISLGCCYLASAELGEIPGKFASPFLGRSFSDHEILSFLEISGVKFRKLLSEEISEVIAEKLNKNKIVGIFRGRSEFGPRALGNRSILASPQRKEIKSILNEKIKLREAFRPFGAVVKEELTEQFFIGKAKNSSYMNLVYTCNKNAIELAPGVCHADNTCRVQTVNKNENPDLYALLDACQKLGMPPILINTSFNLSHEPIVYTPQQAVASFFGSGMDVLLIEKFMIEK